MSIDADEDTQRLLDAERVARAAADVRLAIAHLRQVGVALERLPSGRPGADVLREELPAEVDRMAEKLRDIADELEGYRP